MSVSIVVSPPVSLCQSSNEKVLCLGLRWPPRSLRRKGLLSRGPYWWLFRNRWMRILDWKLVSARSLIISACHFQPRHLHLRRIPWKSKRYVLLPIRLTSGTLVWSGYWFSWSRSSRSGPSYVRLLGRELIRKPSWSGIDRSASRNERLPLTRS